MKRSKGTIKAFIANPTVAYAIQRINELIPIAKSFKIGKTDKTVDERFRQEYENTYNYFIIILRTADPKLVEQMKKILINFFYNNSKCDNQKEGRELKVADSEELINLEKVFYNRLRQIRKNPNKTSKPSWQSGSSIAYSLYLVWS